MVGTNESIAAIYQATSAMVAAYAERMTAFAAQANAALAERSAD